ncbi:sensor histidine kinase [Gordonibacter massiliensis (ex Traore et al. 2017)]|uniref:Histidine kinase n=1 Tax=Gordonibacter massiliensis (ex Traore et al. 2017) TaxID=1841863 RepID=A0A842JC39_9ACTN|nr:histidine kinase [Gordonibacter massiliensis (ex Traore et al. 2017)]MBC2889044.1 histidine kinase [Gordonibacter massiliensis (ex Traore et al. 2017)]
MALGAISYINVELEVFGGVLSLVLAVCLLVMRRRGGRLHLLLLAAFLCGAGSQLFDAAAWLVEGDSGPFAGAVMRAAVLATFLLDYAQLAVLAQYVASYLAERDRRVPPFLAWVGWGAAAVMAALVAFNAFVPVFYSFDANNVYLETDLWAVLSEGVMVAFLTVGVICVVRSRKSLEPYALGVLVTSLGVILVAYAAQLFAGGIMLTYLAVTLATVLLYLGVQMEQAHAFQEQRLALERSRTDLMISQIQPHFLYNVLTVVHDLVDVDAREAQRAIREFSAYLRANMDALSQAEPVPFAKELEHVRTYVALEQRRFGDRLRWDEDVRTTTFSMPALTVQPLVENAVRHGVTKRREGGTVRLSTCEVPGGFAVSVADDGVGFDASAPCEDDGRSHVGLTSVRDRLDRMCGGALEVRSAPGEGATVTVFVPREGPKTLESEGGGL